jgi:kinesin family protein 11
MGIQNKASLSRTFTYDRAFGESTSQERLFNESVAPVVDEVLRGYSCTVFCYGQTGTGKTYTMEGPKRGDGSVETEGPDAGIIPRSIKRIFAQMPTKGEEGCDWVVKVSFLEIYNEKLDDLLSPEASSFQQEGGPGMGGSSAARMGPASAAGSGSGSAAAGGSSASGGGAGSLQLRPAASSAAAEALLERLKIVNDDKTGVRVAGLEEIQVASPAECFEHLRRSIAKRATAETKCNAASSRSHCVFTITATIKESFDGEDTLRVGKLNLVDLAG